MEAGKISPVAVFLASDAAHEVNAQIFAVRANEIMLMSQPRPVRSVHTSEGWTPETVAEIAMPAMRGSFFALESLARRDQLGSDLIHANAIGGAARVIVCAPASKLLRRKTPRAQSRGTQSAHTVPQGGGPAPRALARCVAQAATGSKRNVGACAPGRACSGACRCEVRLALGGRHC